MGGSRRRGICEWDLRGFNGLIRRRRCPPPPPVRTGDFVRSFTQPRRHCHTGGTPSSVRGRLFFFVGPVRGILNALPPNTLEPYGAEYFRIYVRAFVELYVRPLVLANCHRRRNARITIIITTYDGNDPFGDVETK